MYGTEGKPHHCAEWTWQKLPQNAGTARGNDGEAKEIGSRQQKTEHAMQQALKHRAPVGLGNMATCVIDQMHVIDAGRAGRHA